MEAERLLDDDDREALIAAVYVDGAQRPVAKKAFGQALAELYARRESVSLSSGSLERLNELLAALGELLQASARQ